MKMKNTDNTSAFSASEYDGEISKTLPYYEHFYKQVTDIVKIQSSKPLTWLDVGCGTGKMAEIAFKTLDIKKFAFCDSSAKMTDMVEKRFGDKNAEIIWVSNIQVGLLGMK